MAPIQGHLMVPKALRILKFAVSQAKYLIRTKAPTGAQTNSSLNPIRSFTQKTIAVNPPALLKQSKPSHHQTRDTRSYSSASNANAERLGPKYNRASFPTSRTSRAISQNGTAPFASTLRPNLTGGTLPRSAGGYGLGGAGRARQFSHTSGCQAQVVQNVSAGIRAFFIGGGKARFDGINPVTGEKQWKTVTDTRNQVYQKWETAAIASSCPRGTSLDFQLSPTITAFLPPKLSESEYSASNQSNAGATLNSTGVLQTLSGDFARAFRDLALITHDLNKLSAFGDLPLSLVHTSHGPVLRVRFPGCDADAVSALCNEVDIRRGVIIEDETWVESRDVDMALLFPFAPTEQSDELDLNEFFVKRTRPPPLRENVEWRDLVDTSLTPTSPTLSPLSGDRQSPTLLPNTVPSPSSLESYESLSEFHHDSSSPLPYPHSPALPRSASTNSKVGTGVGVGEVDFEGVEGIYHFLQAIENARRR